MKKFLLYTLLVLFGCSFVWSATTIEASTNALQLWIQTLVPSFLFPLILVRLLAPYHLLQPLLQPCNTLFIKVFNINSYGMECILTSFLLGFPSSSLFLEECAKENHFTTVQYQRLLNCVFLCSPNFILLSLSILYPSTITYQLLTIQLSCVFVLLFCSRKTPIHMKETLHHVSFLKQLQVAIQKSFEILLMILAFLIMVYVSVDLLSTIFPTQIKIPLKLLSEFSSGCFYLSSLPIPYYPTLLLTSLVLSYGGLCVHMQIISLLDKQMFSYASFMRYRILHILLACLLSYWLWF